jgi:hypothetical protein
MTWVDKADLVVWGLIVAFIVYNKLLDKLLDWWETR